MMIQVLDRDKGRDATKIVWLHETTGNLVTVVGFQSPRAVEKWIEKR